MPTRIVALRIQSRTPDLATAIFARYSLNKTAAFPACAEASAGRRRISDFSRGDFSALPAGRLAACGGEMGSH
ncbi:MAG: hypothetical protein HYT40_02065 [Candidatus Sungbacteria bacterium]|uniref:Uncharacterized protein n=1 Tax=Candidatus Sungiibacteriota bacterium TaxID=2750080 RepID=A0A931SD65_9BACT|nr:hypothetical protein [Candidatus Sungbacteria bacterium]